jgi:hypothetical protein
MAEKRNNLNFNNELIYLAEASSASIQYIIRILIGRTILISYLGNCRNGERKECGESAINNRIERVNWAD